MSLLAKLILRVLAVVALCLACAGAWTMVEANNAIKREVVATADRMERESRNLAWREVMFPGNEGSHAKLAFPEWRSSDTLRIVGPGYCVRLEWTGDVPASICGGGPESGTAPAWFVKLNDLLFGAFEPVERRVMVGRHEVGSIAAQADAGAAAQQAWRQVSVVVGVASAMAAAIGLLTVALIGHALRPIEIIIRGLKLLERGDLSVRLPDFAAREFAHVARAFNELTERLALSTEQRAAVTRRLFEVQEDERRSLARDLHDEFGQCLTATRALAAAVASASLKDRPDLSESAREIGVISEGMAATLKSTLSRLRPPELEDIGLEQSLEHLVGSWNARIGPGSGPRFQLKVHGGLQDAPAEIALTIYRLAQEGLTNAVKHGAPQAIAITVERRNAPEPQITVTVEDDGGGASVEPVGNQGQGLLGLRERVEALGGQFLAEARGRGVRLAAALPLKSVGAARATSEAA
ncbi:histidine kinase [Hansschlegelia quercus]|uniref:Oxygen sensor histidine kinase NreB n=1 Tax=Hansschlegelia quercus TaxID=2528245 RepID=A0A4Q9GKC9_9HYPH|nr:histidine kinase [Hansschlegelia quercus]TBN54743.1 sensor histidine kinase [Hansschlegelia quercus]